MWIWDFTSDRGWEGARGLGESGGNEADIQKSETMHRPDGSVQLQST